MKLSADQLQVTWARDAKQIRAAQRLRFDVFVSEMGAKTSHANTNARLESDRFDPYCDHLIVCDQTISDPTANVIATYRVMTQQSARDGIGFYSATEYDLAPLVDSGQRLLELGRSCVHPSYRGGLALHLMWRALAQYVLQHDIGLMFGVGSFAGTDITSLSNVLAFLHHNHLIGPDLRVRVHDECGISMDLMPADQVDRLAAARALPPLVKAYLRLGGRVGAGAHVDLEFNCTDVCMIMDAAALSQQQRALYTDGAMR